MATTWYTSSPRSQDAALGAEDASIKSGWDILATLRSRRDRTKRPRRWCDKCRSTTFSLRHQQGLAQSIRYYRDSTATILLQKELPVFQLYTKVTGTVILRLSLPLEYPRGFRGLEGVGSEREVRSRPRATYRTRSPAAATEVQKAAAHRTYLGRPPAMDPASGRAPMPSRYAAKSSNGAY